MNLVDRILAEPELQAAPPVLVDVGAAGGVTPVWRRIARHAIGVGFEPDARDATALSEGQRAFRRWVFVPGLVAPRLAAGETTQAFHLTRSPHCSSLLPPRPEELRDWLFAEKFEVTEQVRVAAVTLHAGLAAQGLGGVDWLKCDTQGQDLSLFLSLPEAWRRRVLAVEFEPGLIDAYTGEDKFWHTLRAMDGEPFWISDLEVCGTQRGRKELLARAAGASSLRWLQRLGPTAPGWVNVRFLRRVDRLSETLDRRAVLLAWVFADLLGQHAEAIAVAQHGQERFGGDLFGAMQRHSARRLRWSMLPNLPGWLWHRLGLG